MCCRACAPRHRPRPSHTCWRAAEHGRRAARHPCAPLCSPCCCASTLCIGPHQPRCRAALMYTLVGGQTRCPCCYFLAAAPPLFHLLWHARSLLLVPLHLPLLPHASNQFQFCFMPSPLLSCMCTWLAPAASLLLYPHFCACLLPRHPAVHLQALPALSHLQHAL